MERSVSRAQTLVDASRRAPRALQRDQVFLATSGLLFAASAGGTIYWCRSMPGGMPMPGGWTMSMAWMRMPEQTWIGAAASFMGMWVPMMAAMMLPSLVPMLSSYRRSLRGAGGARLGRLTALAGTAYFLVWAAVGAAAYPVGIAAAQAEMRWEALARSVPLTTGIVLLFAGCVQLSRWKARQLEHCRGLPVCGPVLLPDAGSAWQHGLRLGLRCSLCCSGYMLILLVIGVMDVRAMAVVGAAITLERLAPWPRPAIKAAGVVAVAAGVLQIVRVLGVA